MAKDHPSFNVVTSLKEMNVVVIVFVVDNEKHSKADAWTQLFIMSFGRRHCLMAGPPWAAP